MPVRADELPGLEEAITLDGDVRTLPHQGGAALGASGLDGFFIARFSRRRPLTGHDPVKAALTNNAHRNASGAASGGRELA